MQQIMLGIQEWKEVAIWTWTHTDDDIYDLVKYKNTVILELMLIVININESFFGSVIPASDLCCFFQCTASIVMVLLSTAGKRKYDLCPTTRCAPSCWTPSHTFLHLSKKICPPLPHSTVRLLMKVLSLSGWDSRITWTHLSV